MTAARLADLPDTVPAPIREALATCQDLDGRYGELGWGRVAPVIMWFKDVRGQLKCHSTVLTDLGGTQLLTDAITKLIHFKAAPSTPGQHLGTAVFSEGFGTDEDVQLPPAGAELQATYDDLVAAGRIHQLRSVFAVFSSGWRFYYERERRGHQLAITVYEPGDVWDGGEELDLITALDAKLLASNSAAARRRPRRK